MLRIPVALYGNLSDIVAEMIQRILAVTLFLFSSLCGFCQDTALTSAWKDGRFQVDVPGVVGRSDIVLRGRSCKSSRDEDAQPVA